MRYLWVVFRITRSIFSHVGGHTWHKPIPMKQKDKSKFLKLVFTIASIR